VRKGRSPDAGVRERARLHIVNQLGQLKGLFQKIGQAAATASEDRDFDEVLNHGQQMSRAKVLACLKQAWGCAPERRLSELSSDGLAASLGQVHRARLRDGSVAAIKIQYPKIDKALRHDLSCTRLFFKAAWMMGLQFDAEAYTREISHLLLGELDYAAEARAQQDYARLAGAIDGSVRIPRVIPRLSTPTLLVTQWVDGESLADLCKNWPRADREKAGTVLLTHVLAMLLPHGQVHGDLHPGNLRFRRDASSVRLVLYDFGSVCRINAAQQRGLRELLDGADPLACFLALGFQKEFLAPIAGRLTPFCAALLEPFSTPGPFDPAHWKLSERVAEALGEDRWNFRAAAPAQLLILMRVLHAVCHVLRRLDAPIDWAACLKTACGPQTQIAPAVPLPAQPLATPYPSGAARALIIHVCENGKSRVRLTLDASTLARTDVWLSDDLEARTQARGIDARALARDAIERGYPKGDIFTLNEGAKSISVRLQ
jgi:predicted unusual protein kinase regulating ubiquinone biosynthesis (AarF/ABC1/UbiB family)